MSPPEPISALTAAKHLVALAAADDDSEFLTPLRLQKLLYYAQGWSLALRDRPLFKEPIEAWVWGPVVDDVFQAYKKLGRSGIEPDPNDEYELSQEDQELLDRIWDTYSEHSAISLSRMTHSEPPWNEARAGVPSTQPCTNEITLDSLKRYFRTLVD